MGDLNSPSGMRTTLTQARVSKLFLPATGQRIVYDSRIAGFGVRLGAGGTRAFILRRKIDGKAQTVTLGRFPGLSVEQALKIAQEINGAIARGDDPQQTQRERRSESTMVELFTDYMERHAKEHNSGWAKAQYLYDRFVRQWANRRISTVTRQEIQALHARVGKENGRYQANRLLQMLHAILEHASREKMFVGDNPAHGIKKFRESKRERFLHPDELPQFFKALAEESNETIRDYILAIASDRSPARQCACAEMGRSQF